jgi:hypothetical protein
MQTSRGSNKDGQGGQVPGHGPRQPIIQGGQPGRPGAPIPPPNQQGEPSPVGPHAPMSPGESHIGNVTIFRTAQFFVHAVTRRTSALPSAGGNTTLLEQIRWVSTERQRVVDVQTRLLPQVELFNPVKREIIIPSWFEAVVVVIGLAVVTAVHALNIFSFPGYQVDEGLLMARAWAVMHGNLFPFGPFPYDQTPFGWMLLAGWSFVSGGFGTFGGAINSGRFLMLALSFGSSLLVYLIATRMGGSRSAGLLAMILFALSPLAITYQREVLLDNIGIFWLLLSLCLIVSGNSRLPIVVLSAIAFALAVLTKEVFIIFFPVILYSVWLHATAFQRKFSLVPFTYLALAMISLFGLMALLGGELPRLWSGTITHIQTAVRESNFLFTWNEWMKNEQPLFIISAVALLVNIVGGVRNRVQWLAALLLATMWVFILAANIVYSSYFVILLPFMALNIALAINIPIKALSTRIGFDLVRVLLLFAIVGALAPYQIQSAQAQGLTAQKASAIQVDALNWLRANAPQDAVIVVNGYLYPDLHGGSKSYDKACYYRNELFTTDPKQIGKLGNNWRNIDYLVLDDQMRQELRVLGSQMTTFERALHSAEPPQVFRDAGGSISIYHIVHEKIPNPTLSRIHC